MREARRSTSFKYTTWILAMQWSWAFMRIRMNHLFSQTSDIPPITNLNPWNKPTIDKIRKYEAEEFQAANDDDAEKAEFWIENTIRVFDEMSLTLEECIKCVVPLLRDAAYQWWKTLISVVPRERVTWDFFQIEFRKKYISERFVDQKRKEFLELKQGRMTVSKYEREFVRLSQYARECYLPKLYCAKDLKMDLMKISV
ncbi:Protein MCM10 [Gossypium australe]|uniref:Protein MCM10 n=1 Tax=Gossypium australe TaxID=47621 RepID=A0A5B6WSW9_9ROSI|nr:Protein MCM10 [Gossypium australe]